MVTGTVLPPIPWAHSTSDFGSVWQWSTFAFVVTVNGDARSFYWTISDVSANPGGEPRVFADGTTSTFEQAERQIRETIGKAYPKSMGFKPFAGPLATTFTLGTGEQVDLGVFEAKKVVVTVASRDGADEVYRGVAKVDHYELVLVNGDEQLRILPSWIMDIQPEAALRSQLAARVPTGPATSRTVQGVIVRGCTGRPGFLPGTVEHDGVTCPIHENQGRHPLT